MKHWLSKVWTWFLELGRKECERQDARKTVEKQRLLDPNKKFKNLTEVLDYLVAIISDEAKTHIIAHDSSHYHFGIGMWMRNNWGLWDKESDLHKWFNSIGIWHADDMSGIILTSLKRRLLGQPLGVEDQVRYYQAYWARMEKMGQNGGTVIYPS